MIRACDFLHLAACSQTTTSNECKNAKIKSAKNLTKKVRAISSDWTTKKSFTIIATYKKDTVVTITNCYTKYIEKSSCVLRRLQLLRDYGCNSYN
jgi:hypothetical protein